MTDQLEITDWHLPASTATARAAVTMYAQSLSSLPAEAQVAMMETLVSSLDAGRVLIYSPSASALALAPTSRAESLPVL